MRSAGWSCLLLLASACASPGDAQVLRLLSDSRQVSILTALACGPGDDLQRTPSAAFAPFETSLSSDLTGCTPRSEVQATARQASAFFADSIDIDTDAYAEVYETQAVTAFARSDASILFRLEAGDWYAYSLDVQGTIGTMYGMATLSFSLALQGPRGGAVESMRAQSPADRQRTWVEVGFLHRGILHAGEYRLDAHTTADGHPNWSSSGELRVRFKVRALRTAVESATWEHVKLLYR